MTDANTDSEKLTKKLSAARTRLILERPFLGALTLRMPLVEGNSSWCKTTATDTKKIYFNAKYVENLNLKELQFMLAHNALHNALLHFNRRLGRDSHRWDVACDFAINAILVEDGLQIPSDALYLENYIGMTADEIYPLIKENTKQEPIDQHLYDEENTADNHSENEIGGDRGVTQKQQNNLVDNPSDSKNQKNNIDGNQNSSKESEITLDPVQKVDRPKPLSSAEKENATIQWEQHLVNAAQIAKQADKISHSMMRMVDYLLQPKVPWRNLLAQYLNNTAKEDYSFLRPSRRHSGNAIYPSLHSGQLNVVVVLDSSGSISETESEQFITEIFALKSTINAKVTLIICDEQIIEQPKIYEPWESFDNQKSFAKAGRGTSFIPPFLWVEQNNIAPDLLIYFTDAQGKFPSEPNYPVLWLIKGKMPIPWGQRIQLN